MVRRINKSITSLSHERWLFLPVTVAFSWSSAPARRRTSIASSNNFCITGSCWISEISSWVTLIDGCFCILTSSTTENLSQFESILGKVLTPSIASSRRNNESTTPNHFSWRIAWGIMFKPVFPCGQFYRERNTKSAKSRPKVRHVCYDIVFVQRIPSQVISTSSIFIIVSQTHGQIHHGGRVDQSMSKISSFSC